MSSLGVRLGGKRRGPKIKPRGTPPFRGFGAGSEVSQKIRKQSCQNLRQVKLC